MDPTKVTLQELRKYSDGKVVDVPIMSLYFDKKQVWGQIRPLNRTRVALYKKQMAEGKLPRTSVRILVRKMDEGVNVYYGPE